MGTLNRPLDFAIVGAAKSGTSSLSEYLNQIDGVEILRPKDAHYFMGVVGHKSWSAPRDEVFNNNIVSSQIAYRDQIARIPPGSKVGDASVFYMTNPAYLSALEADMRPDGTVMLVLRRPDDRAYSAYMHLVREGLERWTFEEALDLEQSRRAAGWQPLWWYKNLGYYAEQVQSVYEVFGRDRVVTLRCEDLVKQTERTLRPILERLEVDFDSFQLPRNNASGVPKNHTLQRFLSNKSLIKTVGSKVLSRRLWLRLRARIQHANLERVPMSTETRQYLMDEYREDIEALEDITGLDLASWYLHPEKEVV